MTIALSYDATLSRVQIDLSGLVDGTVQVQRVLNASATDALWSQGIVRGGRALAVQSGAAVAHDAEFFADVANHYRVLDESGTVIESDSITPSLGGKVWLKSIAHPSLNRPLFRVIDRGDSFQRPDRGTVSPVSGRNVPLATSDKRQSPSFTLHVQTEDAAAADELDLILASGGVMFIHVPPDRPVRGGYVYIHVSDQARRNTLERFVFALPCTTVAKPGPDVVGSTFSWGTIERLYGSWEALVAAHPSWRSALASVGDPGDLFEP